MKQWQCGHCGAWVDAGWTRHAHVGAAEAAGLDDLIMQRRVQEMGGAAPVLDGTAPVVTYWRTFKEPTRETPLG